MLAYFNESLQAGRCHDHRERTHELARKSLCRWTRYAFVGEPEGHQCVPTRGLAYHG
jgi:hypothetical protein